MSRAEDIFGDHVMCLWALLLCACCAKGQPSLEGGEDVIDLTTENWEELVLPKKWTLVEYYSPNCGYCRGFAPE
jgi:hypothetical protein